MPSEWQGLPDLAEPKIKSEKVKAKNSKAQKKYRDRKQVSPECTKGSWV
jgi:hypothetical protein